MFEEIVVPLDGSDLSASALGIAIKICRSSGARLNAVSFASEAEINTRRISVEDQVAVAGAAGIDTQVSIVTPTESIDLELQSFINTLEKVLVCMATHGRGRSEALTGSVANSMLQHVKTPILLVGPECDTEAFEPDGNLVVTINQSRTSEAIIPPAIWWAKHFGSPLEFVTVLEPLRGNTMGESVQVERQARAAQSELGRAVNFEVLHGKKPAKVLLERFESSGTKIAAMATHGATGLSRVATGSVTSNVVRHAKCPVLVMRPMP